MIVRTERERERRRTLIALAAALLIHLLIVLVAVILLSLHPDWRKRFEPKAEPPPMKLTIIPPPEPPKPTPTPPAEKEFFDSADGTVSEKPPENATFESDRDTLASSKLPPKSNDQTPTVDGEDNVGLSLVARDLSLGPTNQPTPPTPASPMRQAQTPEKEQVKPEPKKPEEKKPETTPTPAPTPKPKPTPRPEDSELAMLDPSKPQPTPPKEKPEPKKPEEPVKPSPPSKPQPPPFQPQQRVTRLTGGISNQGDKASMAAVATPLGRYKKQLSDAIGSRWYYYVSDMIDLVNVGTVSLRFVVRQDGHVEGVQVLRNSSNESLANCSVRSIIEAEIPPMPKDVAGVVAGGKIEVDYSFTIVGQ